MLSASLNKTFPSFLLLQPHTCITFYRYHIGKCSISASSSGLRSISASSSGQMFHLCLIIWPNVPSLPHHLAWQMFHLCLIIWPGKCSISASSSDLHSISASSSGLRSISASSSGLRVAICATCWPPDSTRPVYFNSWLMGKPQAHFTRKLGITTMFKIWSQCISSMFRHLLFIARGNAM